MAQAHFVKKARKNIYRQGKTVTRVHGKGKNVGGRYTTVDRTIPADEKDKVFIAKGESYWWWEFRFSPKRYSKTRPKRSQLTQSNWLSSIYALEEGLEAATASSKDDLISVRDELIQEIESLMDEIESSKSNLPEQFQDTSPSALTLQEYYAALESWKGELDGLTFDDIDEDELREDAKKEVDFELEEDEPLTEEAIEARFQEMLQEKVDEALSELQGLSSNL